MINPRWSTFFLSLCLLLWPRNGHATPVDTVSPTLEMPSALPASDERPAHPPIVWAMRYRHPHYPSARIQASGIPSQFFQIFESHGTASTSAVFYTNAQDAITRFIQYRDQSPSLNTIPSQLFRLLQFTGGQSFEYLDVIDDSFPRTAVYTRRDYLPPDSVIGEYRIPPAYLRAFGRQTITPRVLAQILSFTTAQYCRIVVAEAVESLGDGSTEEEDDLIPTTIQELCDASEASTSRDCCKKVNKLLQTLPNHVQQVTQQLEATCSQSQSIGLCKRQVSRVPEPYRTDTRNLKRRLPRAVKDVQEGACPADQPPRKKAADCNVAVARAVQPYLDLEADELRQRLAGENLEEDVCSLQEVLVNFIEDSVDGGSVDVDSLDEDNFDSEAFNAFEDEGENKTLTHEKTATAEQTTWSQFVQQVRERYGITEQRLRTYLDQGVQYHGNLYNLLQERFPLVLALLLQMAEPRGTGFSSCVPHQSRFSKRSIPEAKLGARSNKGQSKSLCDELLAQLGLTGTMGVTHGPPCHSDPCTHFDQLQFYMQLSNEYFAGTWDTLSVLMNSTAQLIAQGPSRGFHAWVKINMMATFGSDTVAVRDISRVGIVERPNSVFGNDRWQLLGIKLTGQCVGSDRVLEFDKYSNVNKYIRIKKENPPWGGGFVVWGDVIDYKDWHVGTTPPATTENPSLKCSPHKEDEL